MAVAAYSAGAAPALPGRKQRVRLDATSCMLLMTRGPGSSLDSTRQVHLFWTGPEAGRSKRCGGRYLANDEAKIWGTATTTRESNKNILDFV